MKQTVVRHDRNLTGRDYAVGDIHGTFSRLEAALEQSHFDPAHDRLFSVGDLIDRGPESERAVAWLSQPWFHAVRGNHEDYAIRHAMTGRVDVDNYRRNGGGWFIDLPHERQMELAAVLAELPFARSIETLQGLVGIVHADCPVSDWIDLPAALATRRGRNRAIWDRRRIETGDTRRVHNVYAVIVGHSPVDQVLTLGNVVHIDTGGWSSQGYFTVLDLDTIPKP